ncbi:TPA: Arc family DNA-binding protein [Listeria monocytogenes]|uniref:Arc family DNA-binding protein n=1 Tax=Listeria monocytogenes TaxID=1639 RepID=UPI00164FB237|nr:Arc family DNA-binding protein [Listeria monocytogenes]MBC6362290.1 hypothetical protein [Listeria monocytogenes]HAO6187755.1 Arc family DNA-binding protein [Listeria monocytogenes]HCY9071798.1 Arc family DNA-binding protein [Listeria monocytogenes]
MKEGNEKAEVKKQTTLRLPAELYERIKQEAERNGVSFNEQIILDESEKYKINF